MIPVLSILVPTYNRVNDLRRLLPLLCEALERHPEVDLVVSNNASADDTRAFLDSLPTNSRLRIVHQPINYGPNLHLAWLYGQATGEFLWLLCDDDIFVEGTVEKILETIRATPGLGWIHLPHMYLKSVAPEEVPVGSEAPAENAYFAKGRIQAVAMLQWVTFASSNIVRSRLIHAHIGRLTFRTMFWPTRLLVQATVDHPSVVLAGRWVKAGPEISWKEIVNEVSNVHLPQTILQMEFLSNDEKRAALRQIFQVDPNRLERLLVIGPATFVRVIFRCPRVLLGFFSTRFFRKIFAFGVWVRLFRGLMSERVASAISRPGADKD